MASRYLWSECSRVQLAAVLPEALVVLPVGAVEQHGPHLPAGTDTLIVSALVPAALTRAAAGSARDLVEAPALPFGASDHHLPFGATLSLTAEALTSALLDLARSIALAGGRRLLIVNGHGGNRGPCHAAAQAAASRHGLAVGYLDYWELLLDGTEPSPPIPGHAGAFETSLISHLRPELVAPHRRPQPPPVPAVADVVLHDQRTWAALDGHTDDPAGASAAAGRAWFERCTEQLAQRVESLAGQL